MIKPIKFSTLSYLLITFSISCYFSAHAAELNNQTLIEVNSKVIEKKPAESTAVIDKKMYMALQQDQQHRTQINRLKRQQKNTSLIQQLERAQFKLDQQNIQTLDRIIEQLGHWPSVSDVGVNPAKIALLLYKRSSIEQQATYLPMIRDAVLNRALPADWYAEAHDHHLMHQNLPQAYGHLMIKSPDDNSQTLYPIESIKAVDNNRVNIGLPPLKQKLGDKNLLLRLTLDSTNSLQGFEVLAADQLIKMADLALACLDQEYPNSVKHVLNNKADAAAPKELYPAFFGCFDWHSSVHGHWLLVRVAKLFPNHEKTPHIIKRLDAHFNKENLQAELDYFQQPGRAGFERPYGLAWYLQLYAELHNWQHPKARGWLPAMTPLKNHIVNQQLSTWIPKLAYPIRTGEHSQTAFAFGLALDYAQLTGDTTFGQLIIKHSRRLYAGDADCPIDYEPSGQDFLSPCLAQADLMRRILEPQAYSRWLKQFLPNIKKGSRWLKIAQVTDRIDGKLAHLDGLNIARAWMLEGIASGLPQSDKRRPKLAKLADQHAQSGLQAVTGEHYAGGHWLGSFATYYLTQRGLDH